MRCLRCEPKNRPGAKFREECGALLARQCDKCGAKLSAVAKFYSECAHPTGVAAAPTELGRAPPGQAIPGQASRASLGRGACSTRPGAASAALLTLRRAKANAGPRVNAEGVGSARMALPIRDAESGPAMPAVSLWSLREQLGALKPEDDGGEGRPE